MIRPKIIKYKVNLLATDDFQNVQHEIMCFLNFMQVTFDGISKKAAVALHRIVSLIVQIQEKLQ